MLLALAFYALLCFLKVFEKDKDKTVGDTIITWRSSFTSGMSHQPVRVRRYDKSSLEDCFAKLELSLLFHFIVVVILSYKISEGIHTYKYYSLLNLPYFLMIGVGSSCCLLTLSLWMVLRALVAVMWSWGMCFRKLLFEIPITIWGFYPNLKY